ncbi:ATP/GTP-binding protein [Aspergillus affinis]|uniref:ATP/GTP-binding protein n=1 Tax=Aspergillus affinis TaxID=1070780 RepID=UPI0022FEF457|nr:uncharacterized protein KD926_005145 [Aspergillus affinis]KAI9034895.1 hypothetical protein KD926_005145 [Aspergillus affinis]
MAAPLIPKNIYIVGAHSTGKTTLIEALKVHLTLGLVRQIFGPTVDRPNYLAEVVRMVMYMYDYNANDIRDPVKGYMLQLRTLLNQWGMESIFNNHWMISDRSGIDPIVYAHVFLGGDESSRLLETPAWRVLRDRMRQGLVILCEPCNATWLSSDPVRVALHKDEWYILTLAFRVMLREQGINFVTIPANMEDMGDRVQFVEGLIRSGI